MQTFSKWLLVAEYAINKDYIAKNLCENRSKPKLHCNGKCQLAKKLAAEEEQSSKSSSGNTMAKAPFSEVLITNESINLSLPIADKLPAYNSFYLVKKYSSPHSSVFHPPLV